MVSVARIFHYPVKSCRRVEVQTAQIGPEGIFRDRDYMIADAEGKLISQREVPQLALIDPTEVIALAAPVTEKRRPVTVHSWTGEGVDQGDTAAQFLGDICGIEARLIRFPSSYERQTGRGDGVVRYADGYPLLVVSNESLSALNDRLDEDIVIERFRPSIVIEGLDRPWAEDDIDTLGIGTVQIDLIKACGRCTVIAVDQDTAGINGEPLKELGRFRLLPREDRGQDIGFGMNAVPRTFGAVSVGDDIEVTYAAVPYVERVLAAKGKANG